jgi:Fusaric acid resistance protein-like
VAAGLAWAIATEVLGEVRPFFAPVAALIALALTGGQRGRRAVEIAAGVTVGIAVADAIVLWVGSGIVQLTVIVLLAMAVAVFLGGGAMAVTQAGVSAAFVVTLEQPDGFAFDRTYHAAIGCACALVVSYLILPLDPLRLVRGAAGPVLHELGGTLEDIAAALDAGDIDAAKVALIRARAADPLARDFSDALVTGRETAVAALPRRRALGTVDVYTHAGAHLDLAVRNVRVLARGAVRALEVGDHIPPGVTAALRELAAAVRALEGWFHDQDATGLARDHAVAAAREASAVLEQTANLSVSVIVGAIRSAAVDLLRSIGLEREQAVRLVRGEVVL